MKSEILYKVDLAQMGLGYFASLDYQTLIRVTCRLHETAVELWEQVYQDSKNSFQPLSSDDPLVKAKRQKDNETPKKETDILSGKARKSGSKSKKVGPEQRRHTGKQPSTPGIWRSEHLKAEQTISHYPDHCAASRVELSVSEDSKPYMGYYVLDLEKTDSGFRVFCSLHHFYSLKYKCCGVDCNSIFLGYLIGAIAIAPVSCSLSVFLWFAILSICGRTDRRSDRNNFSFCIYMAL